jgi:hypothetical protein
MSRENLESSRKLFFILLWVDIVATAIIGLNAFSTVGTLRDIDAGRVSVDQSMLSSFDFWDNLAKLTILTLIGVGIGLVRWLNACYSYAKVTIGVSGLRNEGYTTWGWLIPVFNLFKPYQVISEIYKVGSPNYTSPEDWKHESGSGALLVWWIFWAITHLIMWVMARMIISSTFGESATMRGAIMANDLQAWACAVSLVFAGLWFWVANLLTQRLLDRNTVLANSPPLQYAYQAPISAIKAGSAMPMPLDQDAVYAIVASEMDSGKIDKGLWTRLFAECGGDERQVKVRYIKERAERLIGEQVRLVINTKTENHTLPKQAIVNSGFTATSSPTNAPVFTVPNKNTKKQKINFSDWRVPMTIILFLIGYQTHIAVFLVICLPILWALIATWPRHPLPPPDDSSCPLCGGPVNSEAKQCRHCNTAFIGTISPKHMKV